MFAEDEQNKATVFLLKAVFHIIGILHFETAVLLQHGSKHHFLFHHALETLRQMRRHQVDDRVLGHSSTISTNRTLPSMQSEWIPDHRRSLLPADAISQQENQTTRTSRKRKAADDDEPVAGNLQQQSPASTTTMSNIQSASSAPFAKRLQDTLRAPIPAAQSTTPVNQSLAYAVAPYPPSGPAQTTPSSEFIASRNREYGPAPAPSLDNRTGNALKGDYSPKWKYDATSR